MNNEDYANMWWENPVPVNAILLDNIDFVFCEYGKREFALAGALANDECDIVYENSPYLEPEGHMKKWERRVMGTIRHADWTLNYYHSMDEGDRVVAAPQALDAGPDSFTGDYASFFSWLKALPDASPSDVADIDEMISGYEPD